MFRNWEAIQIFSAASRSRFMSVFPSLQVFSQKPQRKFGAAIAGNGFQPGRPSSRTATLPSQTYCTLWSSPNISHLNLFLSLQCLICLSSCDFAHQSGGSSPSSSLYYICGVVVFVGLPVERPKASRAIRIRQPSRWI